MHGESLVQRVGLVLECIHESSCTSNTSVVQSSRIMDYTHRGKSMPSSFNADCVGAFPVKSSSSSCDKSKTHCQHPKTLTPKLQTLAANPSLHFHCRLSQNVIPTTPKLYTSDLWVAFRSSMTSSAQYVADDLRLRRRRRQQLREPEIGNARVQVSVEQNVGRFDVRVDVLRPSLCVQIRKPPRSSRCNLHPGRPIQRRPTTAAVA